MTKGEAEKIEAAIVESKEAAWRDANDIQRTPARLKFTPTIELYHDGHPSSRLDLRRELAAELRRIANYLEL